MINNYYASFFDRGGKMSLPERLFRDEGYLLVRETLPPDVYIECMMYEWESFNLPGGRYTPDFFIRLSNKDQIYVEVKQESFSKSGRVFRGKSYSDSRAKLRACASLNPWHTFYMAIYSRGGWRLELIEPEQFFYPESTSDDRKGNDNGSDVFTEDKARGSD